MSRQKKTKETDPHKALYNKQNRAIHKARALLGMDLDCCRELARQVGGKPSISSLNLRQRWKLIQILKSKGANVYNPYLPSLPVSPQGSPQAPRLTRERRPAPKNEGCSVEIQESGESLFYENLEYWNKRFPKDRPGYASNRQLAWILTLWQLDWDDGRVETQKGLRGFIFRQTKNLKGGPIGALDFLLSNHVKAVITPLKKRAEENYSSKVSCR